MTETIGTLLLVPFQIIYRPRTLNRFKFDRQSQQNDAYQNIFNLQFRILIWLLIAASKYYKPQITNCK